MVSRIFALGLAVALVPLYGLAETKKIYSVEGATEYHLDNGLKVLLIPDQSKQKVTVNLTILVGSRHEGYGETGMAHLLEHMVFKGTKKRPGLQIVQELKDKGAQFNGSTWLDRTNYFETLNASDENLEWAIDMEADRMMNSVIRREDLATEFSVVRNEFEAGENNPQSILSQRVTAVAFEWHNYGKSTIGNRSDIERVPVDNLREFYSKFYQPDNAILIVSGKFEEAKALTLAEKYFGVIPKPTRKLPETYTEEPAQDGERQVTLRRVGEVSAVEVAYHVPSGPNPEYAAVSLLDSILTSQPSGRLYKALIETNKGVDLFAFSFANHDPSLFELGLSVRANQNLEEAKDTLISVVEGFKAKPVTEEEVERAKREWLNARDRTLEDTQRLAVEMSEWAAQGDWRLFYLFRDRIEKVTAKEVQAAAEKYFTRPNRTLGLFIPTKEAERTSVPQAPALADMLKDYKGRKAASEVESFDSSPEAIEKRVIRKDFASGIKATMLPKKTRGEAVSLRLVLRYGSEDTLKGMRANCALTPELMTKGTKTLDRQKIKDTLDKAKSSLSSTGQTAEAAFLLTSKRKELPQALAVLKSVLREPTFPAAELEIIKNRQIGELEQASTEPMMLVQRLAMQKIDPRSKEDVRYSPSVSEEIEQIKNVNAEGLQKFYQEFFGASAGELTVVGDFDPEEVFKTFEDIFADWKAPTPYKYIATEAQVVQGSRDQLETPDKENALYAAGLPIQMKDTDADFPAMAIANFVFGGGGLSSRLGNRLRQKEGWSYGAGSMVQADPIDNQAVFLMFAIANPTNCLKVEGAAREELDKILASGITDDELAKAKKGFIEQQRVGRTNDRALLQTLSQQRFAGRTMEYYADLEKKVNALTKEDVAGTIKKRIDPEKLVVVIGGDFKNKAKTDEPKKEADKK